MTHAGSASETLVETLDIYPTLIDLCQPSFQSVQYPLDGKSLVPLLKNPQNQLRDFAFSYWQSAISLRSNTHRLIAQKKEDQYTNIELYDMRDSPDPIRNLAKQESELVNRLLEKMPKR
jgi:arylsulfatase A-like enzyme